jgi:hypothetical protein
VEYPAAFKNPRRLTQSGPTSLKLFWKVHVRVTSGRRPDKKLFLEGPQTACWQ